MMTPQHSLPELDYAQLDRDLDRLKTKVFLGKHSAFLGTLMCSLEFQWTTSVPTAAVNGTHMFWNPYYFHFLSQEGRVSIIHHELWHVGLLHVLRRGERDPKIWNYACDTVLDNMMDLEGYCVDSRLFPVEMGYAPGTKSFVNHAKYGTMSAEEIYEIMIKEAIQPPPGTSGDILAPADGAATHATVNAVVSAVHAAKLSGAGNLPGNIEETLSKFLAPKLPWKEILQDWFNQLDNKDYSWSRPNRRYQDMYLPSLVDDRDGLDDIRYFLDVSGSISESDIIRFHSEFKHVKETYQPKKMTMAQFDTKITKEDVFLDEDPFEETHVVGRGGTSLVCVRDNIIEHEPTAVVVFSDLQCEPMEPLPAHLNIPIIWIALNNHSAKINMGQIVHLNE